MSCSVLSVIRHALARPRRALFLAFLAAVSLPSPGLEAQSATAVDSEQITLRPGDVVHIRVWRKPELSGEFTVAADGAIGDPFYSSVRVSGLSLTAARERVRDHIARIESEPLVWIEAVFRVAVTGEVNQPNLYPLRHPTTLAQAIAAAGGATPAARLNQVKLVRDGASRTVDLRNPASADARIVLLSGDEIIVPRRTSLRDAMVPVSAIASVLSLIVVLSR
jgi:polysaccharide export outer membrane protein